MKLFYDNPTIAFYMAEEFGIEYIDLIPAYPLIYVNPSQAGEFLLKHGDIAFYWGYDTKDKARLIEVDEQKYSYAHFIDGVDNGSHAHEIIMRREKHFFMPKVEQPEDIRMMDYD